MMGWDLAQIELCDLDPNSPTGVDNDAKNIDGDKFTDIRNRILEAYARGGVTTIGWHTTNPATGGTAWDVTCRRRTDYSRRRPARKNTAAGWTRSPLSCLAQDRCRRVCPGAVPSVP